MRKRVSIFILFMFLFISGSYSVYATEQSSEITEKGTMPVISASNQVLTVGDKLTDKNILSWATFKNIDELYETGYYFLNDETPLSKEGILTKAGTYTLVYYADDGGWNFHEQPYTRVEKKITLTVKEKIAEPVTPTITASDHQLFVGDRLTDEEILSWVTVSEKGYKIEYKFSPKLAINDQSYLTSAEKYELTYTASNGAIQVSKTIMVTVLSHSKTSVTTVSPTSSPKKSLPKTGEITSNNTSTLLILFVTIVSLSYYKYKKRAS